ncbi:MAG: sensor histidine kinase [Solibacteraceae bacterium]|nr:sensor histidine kinase [Solibacteraceae bacterium]
MDSERPTLNWRAIALVLAGIALTSAGHYLTPRDMRLWHGIFQRLYYLPVVYAAIAFGWIGGLAAAVAAALLYIPHIVMMWGHEQHYAMEQYAEIFMFLAVGIVTGVLSDRERKRRNELQITARKLSQVYRELQDTFEQVKRADRLSAIGQLAAGLAHEIRNPLASIDGAAEVLDVADERPELRKETVSIIRKECSRLNRLLTGLLDFARPRRPEWREVDLCRVLDSVIDLVSHSAGKGIRFHKETPREILRLVGDQEQLTQVMLNLTLNAAQAMPEGGDVWLTARQDEDGIMIRIKDQGAGIPEENLDKIFDPFFTTKDTGTGLGLSVAHQIVTQHGGTIMVSRNPDKGTTFNLFFPQSRGDLA